MKIEKIDVREIDNDTLDAVFKSQGYKAYNEIQKDRYKKTRIYVHPKGESVMENLFNRHTRPYTLYKKEVLPAVLERMGLPKETKVRWSQHAGCSCPCSPGFVCDSDFGRTVFVDVNVDEKSG